MPEGPTIQIEVTRAEAGLRLDRLLQARIPWRSRPSLSALVNSGEVLLNGRGTKPARRVSAGDRVATSVRDPRPLSRQSLPRELPVLADDPDFLAIDKPAGLSTHPTGRHLRNNVLSALRWRYGEPPPHPVHRLDLETSGVLLCSRSREAHRVLALQFERREVEKHYLAVVVGRLEPASGVLSGALGRDGGSEVRVRMRAGAGSGAPARTDFRVVARWQEFSLLCLRPHTGRQHQIRAHLAEAGHPVEGDNIYGPDERNFLAHLAGRLPEPARRALLLDRHALHAAALRFRHPRTNAPIEARAPMPLDLRGFVEGLGPALAGAPRGDLSQEGGGWIFWKGLGGTLPLL